MFGIIWEAPSETRGELTRLRRFYNADRIDGVDVATWATHLWGHLPPRVKLAYRLFVQGAYNALPGDGPMTPSRPFPNVGLFEQVVKENAEGHGLRSVTLVRKKLDRLTWEAIQTHALEAGGRNFAKCVRREQREARGIAFVESDLSGQFYLGHRGRLGDWDGRLIEVLGTAQDPPDGEWLVCQDNTGERWRTHKQRVIEALLMQTYITQCLPREYRLVAPEYHLDIGAHLPDYDHDLRTPMEIAEVEQCRIFHASEGAGKLRIALKKKSEVAEVGAPSAWWIVVVVFADESIISDVRIVQAQDDVDAKYQAGADHEALSADWVLGPFSERPRVAYEKGG